jgi:hypothetical protein
MISERTWEAVVDEFKKGINQKMACALHGVSVSAFIEWAKLPGNQDMIDQAKAECYSTIVACAKKAVFEDPKQAFTWLERRHPEEWSRKEKVEHSGEMTTNVTLNFGKSKDKEDETN